jgi:hypothetical protein
LSKSLNVAAVGMDKMGLLNTSILSVLPNVKGVAVGVLKKKHAVEPFALLRERL